MRTKIFVTLLAAAASAFAQPSNKVGVIHIQNAIISTKDGQKAAGELQAKFDPKKKELEQKQEEINSLQAELSKGSNTMAEARRTTLTRDIDQKSKALTRATEDAQAEFEQEQNKILNELGNKMMAIIDKYAKDHGFSLVLDVSSPQTPVLYVADGIDVTKDIIDLYDKTAPGPAPAAAKPAPTSAAPKPPAPKPAAPPK